MHSDRPSQVEFFFRNFSVNSAVLMPRLETESLVRRALAELRKELADVIVDVGTGSGIIAVSLAGEIPRAEHIALDISPDALSLAKANAQANHVDIGFLESDLLSALFARDFSWKYLFFAANLPYIRSHDPDVGEDVALLDPHLALYGWDVTGFECIERFIKESLDFARTAKGLRIMLEFGHDQLEIARETAMRHGYDFESFSDLSNIPRFALLTYARPH